MNSLHSIECDPLSAQLSLYKESSPCEPAPQPETGESDAAICKKFGLRYHYTITHANQLPGSVHF